MKKSLVIISFAFILLLSMSIVSAGFWDWLNGDVVRTSGSGEFDTKRITSDGSNIPRLTFPSREGRISFLKQSGSIDIGGIDCPRGWGPISYLSGGQKKECCVEKSKTIAGSQGITIGDGPLGIIMQCPNGDVIDCPAGANCVDQRDRCKEL